MHAHARARTHAHMHMRTCAHALMRSYLHRGRAHMCAHISASLCTHAYVPTHHAHAHLHAHSHRYPAKDEFQNGTKEASRYWLAASRVSTLSLTPIAPLHSLSHALAWAPGRAGGHAVWCGKSAGAQGSFGFQECCPDGRCSQTHSTCVRRDAALSGCRTPAPLATFFGTASGNWNGSGVEWQWS